MLLGLGRLTGELGRGDVVLTEGAVEALRVHHWPGNFRELRNVLERALLRTEGHEIDAMHLELAGRIEPAEGAGLEKLEDVERWHIARVLAQEQGHVDRAAARLGVPRSTLYKLVKRLGI